MIDSSPLLPFRLSALCDENSSTLSPSSSSSSSSSSYLISALLENGWAIVDIDVCPTCSRATCPHVELLHSSRWLQTFAKAFSQSSEAKAAAGSYRIVRGTPLGYKVEEGREFFETRVAIVNEKPCGLEPDFPSTEEYTSTVLALFCVLKGESRKSINSSASHNRNEGDMNCSNSSVHLQIHMAQVTVFTVCHYSPLFSCSGVGALLLTLVAESLGLDPRSLLDLTDLDGQQEDDDDEDDGVDDCKRGGEQEAGERSVGSPDVAVGGARVPWRDRCDVKNGGGDGCGAKTNKAAAAAGAIRPGQNNVFSYSSSVLRVCNYPPRKSEDEGDRGGVDDLLTTDATNRVASANGQPIATSSSGGLVVAEGVEEGRTVLNGRTRKPATGSSRSRGDGSGKEIVFGAHTDTTFLTIGLFASQPGLEMLCAKGLRRHRRQEESVHGDGVYPGGGKERVRGNGGGECAKPFVGRGNEGEECEGASTDGGGGDKEGGGKGEEGVAENDAAGGKGSGRGGGGREHGGADKGARVWFCPEECIAIGRLGCRSSWNSRDKTGCGCSGGDSRSSSGSRSVRSGDPTGSCSGSSGDCSASGQDAAHGCTASASRAYSCEVETKDDTTSESPPRCLAVVFVGELLQVLTGGIFRAAPHRVVLRPADRLMNMASERHMAASGRQMNTASRISCPFLIRGKPDAIVRIRDIRRYHHRRLDILLDDNDDDDEEEEDVDGDKVEDQSKGRDEQEVFAMSGSNVSLSTSSSLPSSAAAAETTTAAAAATTTTTTAAAPSCCAEVLPKGYRLPNLDGTPMKLLHRLLEAKRKKCATAHEGSDDPDWVLCAFPDQLLL